MSSVHQNMLPFRQAINYIGFEGSFDVPSTIQMELKNIKSSFSHKLLLVPLYIWYAFSLCGIKMMICSDAPHIRYYYRYVICLGFLESHNSESFSKYLKDRILQLYIFVLETVKNNNVTIRIFIITFPLTWSPKGIDSVKTLFT